jgi:hypothetical protein
VGADAGATANCTPSRRAGEPLRVLRFHRECGLGRHFAPRDEERASGIRCNPAEGRGAGSLDFRGQAAGIAGHEPLSRAVHDQIEILEDDRAEESGLPSRLDDGGERAVATQNFDVDPFRPRALGLRPSA